MTNIDLNYNDQKLILYLFKNMLYIYNIIIKLHEYKY